MFPYIGGKSRHIKWIDNFFPDITNTFVDVFGGAGWVSIKSKKTINAKTKVYNDLNPHLSNAFQCFTTDPKHLLEHLLTIPKSDYDIYRKYQKELFTNEYYTTGIPDYEWATKYLYIQTQIFSGTPLSLTNVPYFIDVKTKGRYPSRYNNLIKKLQNENVVDRLKMISKVENMDCVDVIEKYDNADTFFYIDPPYFKCEFYYTETFPTEKHYQLAETLSNIKGKFAISYYDFQELSTLYPKSKYTWHTENVYKDSSTRGKNNIRANEVLIMNY